MNGSKYPNYQQIFSLSTKRNCVLVYCKYALNPLGLKHNGMWRRTSLFALRLNLSSVLFTRFVIECINIFVEFGTSEPVAMISEVVS